MSDLQFRVVYGSLDLTAYPFAVRFGSNMGAPQSTAEALELFLQDGEVELSTRASNRTVEVPLLIEGGNMAALAEAEAALVLESEKPLNTLTVYPGDGFGPPTVFDTFRGQVVFDRDDNAEVAGYRSYALTVRALPWARSESETTTAALDVTGTTTTLLDDCSATTGWSGTVDGLSTAPASASGSVLVSASTAKGSHSFTLRKTFAATTTSTKLLIVDWAPPAGGIDNTDGGVRLHVLGDGVDLPLIAESASPVSGYTRSHYRVAAASLSDTLITWRGYFPAPGTPTLKVANVAVSDVNPVVGTARQQARSLRVDGATRTPGSLAVESESAALGDGTMVYVYRADESTAGYSPALRQFRTTGDTVTTDTGLVSGASEPIDGATPVTFDVPIGLFPQGTYLLMARLVNSPSGGDVTVTYTTSTSLSGNYLASSSGTAEVSLLGTGTYANFALARLMLPTVDLDPRAAEAGATMRLTLSADGACTLDEAWLFNQTIGALIAVDCGNSSLTGAKRLYIEPASASTPRPTVRVGRAADRSDSHYPPAAVLSWQTPQFTPPQVNVFTVTPNATDAGVSLSYYQRWHTHAAT